MVSYMLPKRPDITLVQLVIAPTYWKKRGRSVDTGIIAG